MANKPKLRCRGDIYRPTVEVMHASQGIPTKVMINGEKYERITLDHIPVKVEKRSRNGLPTKVSRKGRNYAYVHPQYINGAKNKVEKKG